MVVGFFSFISLNGCKEKQTIGTDLIPPVDNINTFEVKDFNLQVNTEYHDSLFTNDNNYMLMALGKISNDPFFGITNAGIYMQFKLPELGFKFPQGSYDSVILSVPYYISTTNGYAVYGDTSTNIIPVKLNAYQIVDPFYYEREKVYFAHDSLGIHHVPLGSGSYTLANFTDTIVLNNGDTVRNMLRMKLNDGIKNYLVNAPASVLDLNTNFADYFKGIYLAPAPNSTGSFIGMFRLDGGNDQFYSYAQLTFYYKKTGDTATSKFNLKFNPGNTPFFNSIRRDYTGTPAQNYISKTNADTLLVQGYPGFRSEIEIKIDNKIPNAIINKATLEITALNVGLDGFFRNPEQLLVMGIDEDGKEYTIADRLGNAGNNTNVGVSLIGGTPFVSTIGTNKYIKYHINMPRELQQAVLEGREKIKIRIYSSTAYPSFFRLAAGGPNAAETERLNFHVVYSLK